MTHLLLTSHDRDLQLTPSRLLGRGGMGQVWLAERGGQQVAVKFLMGEQVREPRFLRLFRAEVQSHARMMHPGIVQILDAGVVPEGGIALGVGERVEAGSPYLVMEYVEGPTLQALMGQLPWPQLRRVLLELLDALGHAHAMGIIHRDLKPQNILLVGTPGGFGMVRLVDFGVAHRMEQGLAEARAEISPAEEVYVGLSGTPRYMSPEQIANQPWRQGPWTDLYALGCLVWQLVCVRGPYEGSLFDLLRAHMEEPLPPWTPQLATPAGLEGWVSCMLSKQPHQRFQRAADAAGALRALESIPRNSAPITPLRPLVPLVAPTWRTSTDTGRARPGLGLWGVRTLPLLGREVERDVLWALLRQSSREGRPRAALLTGEAGSGKSRLAQWLLGRAHELGAAQPLLATHSPEPGALGGIGPMLARALRVDQLPEEVPLAEHLLERYEALGMTRQDAIFEVSPLTALVAPPERMARITAQQPNRRERLQTTLGLLRLLAVERPLLIWLDDAGWDEETLALALRLLGERDLRCLILLTQRDGEPISAACAGLLDELRGHRQVQELEIGPLDMAERDALLRGALGLERTVADEVGQLTQGNPLFALQLVGDWLERGALVPSKGGYVARPGAPLQLPDDLHHVWQRRLDHLLAHAADRDHALRSLELAAVLGHEVAWHEWHYASRQAGLVLSPELVDRMTELGLTRRGRRSMSFVHGLLRESISRGSKEAGRWAGLHRICAEMVEAMYPERHLSVMARLAEHRWQAGDMEGALPALYLAMDHAADMGDYDLVDTFLARHAHAMEALGLPEEHPHRCRHHGQLSSQLHRKRRHEEAFELQREAIEAARRRGWSEELAIGLRRLGRAQVSTERLDQARVALEEALVLFEALGDDANLIRTRSALVGLCRRRHLRDEALAHVAALRALEQRQGSMLAGAHAYLDMSFLLADLGELEGAMSHLEEAKQRAGELGSRSMQLWCLNAMGDIARLLEDYDHALELYERALRIDTRFLQIHGSLLMLNIAMLRAERGEWGQARAQLDETERLLEEDEHMAPYLIHTNLVRMCCGGGRGDWELWDQGAAQVAARWPHAEATAREVALLAQRAARLAEAAGHAERAALPARVAAEIFAQLNPTRTAT